VRNCRLPSWTVQINNLASPHNSMLCCAIIMPFVSRTGFSKVSAQYLLAKEIVAISFLSLPLSSNLSASGDSLAFRLYVAGPSHVHVKEKGTMSRRRVDSRDIL
jgi:hypothetical protein